MTEGARELESAEVAGWADLVRAAPAALARERGIALLEREGVICTAVASGDVPPRAFNHAMGLGLRSDATEADLDAVDRFYDGLGCPFYVWLAPEALPLDLGDRLLGLGYAADYPWVKFRRAPDSGARADTELLVEEIGAEDGPAFGHVVAAAFELPAWAEEWVAQLPGRQDWYCFLGRAGPEPASAGAMFVEDDVAWLGLGATLHRHRGRGGQGAIFAARVRRASELGCRLLVTETGEADDARPSRSYRNILRAGFERAYLRLNLAAPGRPG